MNYAAMKDTFLFVGNKKRVAAVTLLKFGSFSFLLVID